MSKKRHTYIRFRNINNRKRMLFWLVEKTNSDCAAALFEAWLIGEMRKYMTPEELTEFLAQENDSRVDEIEDLVVLVDKDASKETID